jgi:hypothetical protein
VTRLPRRALSAAVIRWRAGRALAIAVRLHDGDVKDRSTHAVGEIAS